MKQLANILDELNWLFQIINFGNPYDELSKFYWNSNHYLSNN